jgi:type IV fimbrial biogenesis protein FimT
MVVFGILVSIAVPSFTSLMDSLRVKRAADAVNAFLVNAKSEAIKQNTTVRAVVQVENSGATWCIGMTTASTCDCLTGACQIGGADRTVVGSAYKKILLNGPADGFAFVFTPLRGTPQIGTNGTVQLESDNAQKLNVIVGTTGRIRICSPDGSAGGYPACS